MRTGLRLHCNPSEDGSRQQVVRTDRYRHLLAPTLLVGVLLGATLGCEQTQRQEPSSGPIPTQAPDGATTSQDPSRGAPRSQPAFDITAHSTTDPGSIWVVVNKTHPIRPSTFRPAITLVRGYQVASAAAGQLERLLEDSDQEQMGFKIASAFRSYEYQSHVHSIQVAQDGQAAADRVSARPGYSEHQTGLAVDLITPAAPSCDFDQCFASNSAGRWLAQHAWEYGFLIRYTAGNEAITGYRPEPWHLRYVGRPLAAAMRAAGSSTLEEFLDVPGGDYVRR